MVKIFSDGCAVGPLPEIVRALESKGWKMGESWDSSLAMESHGELRLDIGADDSWTIGRFTDSDIDGEGGPVAVGRYQTIDEGNDLSEVLEAVKCAEMGIPRDVDERDLDDRDVDGPVDDARRGPDMVEDIEVEGEHETDLAYEYADQKLTGMQEEGE